VHQKNRRRHALLLKTNTTSSKMAPTRFNHPYEPYPIQTQFMTSVYDCIQQGKIGIFESPTGTGKSLSLICGSLTWLRHHKRDEIDAIIQQGDVDDDEPEWILEHARKERRERAVQHRQELEQRLARIRDRERKLKKRFDSGEPLSKRQKTDHISREEQVHEDHFALDEYESDSEQIHSHKVRSAADYGVSTETQAILKRLGMFTGGLQDDEENEMPDELKVFYCSRTHSQLSQFANELRRVHLPPVLVGFDDRSPQEDQLREELKHLTLGSRKNLCINPKVNKLASATAINERCLELQQSKTSPEHRCQFLPNKENEPLVNEFRDRALAEIQDIEDLGKVGRKIGICPYYATRSAIRPSEVGLSVHILLVANRRADRDASIPSTSAKDRPRSAGYLLEGPCHYH
jgi:chromosome transmission fidelity protein 1